MRRFRSGVIFDAAAAWATSWKNRARRWRSSSRRPIRKTNSSWCSSTTAPTWCSRSPRNLEEIQNRLTFTQSKGRTALLDAIYLALHEMKKGQEPAQGPADHLRRRRQQQPLHGDGNQEPGEGSGRPNLCDRNLRTDRGPRPDSGGSLGPGAVDRDRRADRRPAVPGGEPERIAGYRRQDRNRAAQSVRSGLFSAEPANTTGSTARCR